jgi:hypothetical protein
MAWTPQRSVGGSNALSGTFDATLQLVAASTITHCDSGTTRALPLSSTINSIMASNASDGRSEIHKLRGLYLITSESLDQATLENSVLTKDNANLKRRIAELESRNRRLVETKQKCDALHCKEELNRAKKLRDDEALQHKREIETARKECAQFKEKAKHFRSLNSRLMIQVENLHTEVSLYNHASNTRDPKKREARMKRIRSRDDASTTTKGSDTSNDTSESDEKPAKKQRTNTLSHDPLVEAIRDELFSENSRDIASGVEPEPTCTTEQRDDEDAFQLAIQQMPDGNADVEE